jgi:hypothetical protein
VNKTKIVPNSRVQVHGSRRDFTVITSCIRKYALEGIELAFAAAFKFGDNIAELVLEGSLVVVDRLEEAYYKFALPCGKTQPTAKCKGAGTISQETQS